MNEEILELHVAPKCPPIKEMQQYVLSFPMLYNIALCPCEHRKCDIPIPCAIWAIVLFC